MVPRNSSLSDRVVCLYSVTLFKLFLFVVLSFCSYILVLLVLLCSRTRYAGT